MALSHRPQVHVHRARAVRLGLALVRTLTLGGVASLAYLGLATGAFGPGSGPLGEYGVPGQPAPDLALASLTFSGVDPVITGSVDHLFASEIFAGPNRAQKGDRVRPVVDALTIAKSFENARTRLAALRSPADAAALGQSSLADAGATAEDEGPRMSVASLHPNAAAALDAIAGIAPGSRDNLGQVTMPETMPEQLAYARANEPVTARSLEPEELKVSDRELWCLATAIYFEARGESYRGQVAVAQVVMNRTKDHRYPDTICGVVFQNQHRKNACQFSFACDGIPEVVNERKPWDQAEDIASKVTTGELYLTEVGDATHYHATYVRPAWAPRMDKVTQIGLHVFYKFKRGWLFG
ncbi:cell wall hydrolase [Devosia chinhatensis]|uniref:cell wall hydrolase n=1 Tax=Devosia chinhatensis TaxID=429727 RepID=UPI000A007C74|nr:cell wall hydrolase [Devosia chinhatensis]